MTDLMTDNAADSSAADCSKGTTACEHGTTNSSDTGTDGGVPTL
ncbi:hypothetical protein OL229_16155 [Neisseriaceae bacterium JH1-16]|nr:hypothetical protein [Neisseriaceae bacterium JH1-16]